MKRYPWELKRQDNRWYIKQPIQKDDGKMSSRTYPSRKLRDIRDNEGELRDLVVRLNAELKAIDRAKRAVETKHAYINDKLYDEWLEERLIQTRRASLELTYIKQYFVNYFVEKLNVQNPVDWHKLHKNKWAAFLLSSEVPPAPSTKRDIVQCAQRFLDWLHEKRPEEVPELKLKPFTKNKWKDLHASWELDSRRHEPQFVTDRDWKKIQEHLPKSLAPYVNLGYFYGLRREELLGVKSGDVKQGYLSVERSLEAIGKYKPTKGKKRRKVPHHWFSKAERAYAWVEQITASPLHPDTLTELWGELMDKDDLRMTYTLHDLRHTFLTRAYSLYPVDEVRDAAGHKDIRTTQNYLRDRKRPDDEEYKPAS
jgi:integrase